eukprot:CAMPEP_0115325090 /NCGR_PEP_ID=MMETSP0270-20121206/82827_1 /TAXON_ID=71861 /ORGANISM="Scrippsiella trochoidea, Strain CCMP3099" /LENGTH=124 /DNA_ID=CAMNT_0002745253 /DNA_START=685 /DNA_END=1055 /DNA_ORIENTATION=-
MADNNPKVQKSPSIPAIGEAMLSGSTPRRREAMTMKIMSEAKSSEAVEAAATEAEAMRRMCLGWKAPVVIKSKQKATTAARQPTTAAWHCTTAKFPTAILQKGPHSSKRPRFACVDNRDANVIS